jgi:hypothetical protein
LIRWLSILILLTTCLGFTAIPVKAFDCNDEQSSETCDNHDAYDGYWWRGYWIPGLVTQASRMTPMPVLTVGTAAYYDIGLMEATGEFRNLYTPSLHRYTVNGVDGGYVGGVATETCSEIGTSVWLKREGKDYWEGPYLVVDCARRNDIYGQIVDWHLNIEVDYQTGVRWGMVNSDTHNVPNVQVSKINPLCLGNQAPVDIAKWYKQVVQYAVTRREENFVYYSPSTWLMNGYRTTFYQTLCSIRYTDRPRR